jgi:hypothetical protein
LEHSLHFQRISGFSANPQSQIPTPGGQSLSLIVANLQLNKVPGLPQRSFCPVAFHCLNFVFQAGQSTPHSLISASVYPRLQQAQVAEIH